MLIKGEKYACEACVRGHRVSNCQHSDRPLQHINKKGRPVSQCTHCRTLRKSRSAHVRCECGEKAHSKGGCSHDTDPQADSCCCSHTGRCTCALKKEHLYPVPESDSDEPSISSAPREDKRRPRALTAQSDGGLTIFTNGHHKPVHKHNNMASKCGMPYVVPRAHSIHGPSPAGLANKSVDNLPHTNTIDALHSDSHIKDSMVSAQQEHRKVKSEHGSPHMIPQSNLDELNSQLPPLDLSIVPGEFSYLQSLDNFASVPDHEPPIFSAGLSSASIDWSHYDGLNFNDNFATSSYSQAPSFNGFDFSSIDQPALTTTSTSGEISEVEDFIALNEHNNTRPPLLNNQYGSDFDTSEFGGEIDAYRLSTASSYIGMPQAQMLASNNFDSLDMDAFLKGVQASGAYASPDHGLPVTNYVDDGKSGQSMSPFDDTANFQLLPTEDDNDAFWMQTFVPAGMPISNGHSDIPENSNWAQ